MIISQKTFIDLPVTSRYVVYSYLSPRLRFVFQQEECIAFIAARLDNVVCEVLERVAEEVWENRELPEPRELSVNERNERVDAHILSIEQYFTRVNLFVVAHFPQMAHFRDISDSPIVQCVQVSKWCVLVGEQAKEHLNNCVNIFLNSSQETITQLDAIQPWLEVGVKPYKKTIEELCLRGTDRTIFHYLDLFFQTGVQASDLVEKGKAIFGALLCNPAVKWWRDYFNFLHRQGLEITTAAQLAASLKDASQASTCFFLKLTRTEIFDIRQAQKPLSVACLEKVFSTLEPNLLEATIWEFAKLFELMGMGAKELSLIQEANLAFATLLIEYRKSSLTTNSTATATATGSSGGMPALAPPGQDWNRGPAFAANLGSAGTASATSGSSGIPALAPNQDWNIGEALVPIGGLPKSVEDRLAEALAEAWSFLARTEVTLASHEVVQRAIEAFEHASVETQNKFCDELFGLQEKLAQLEKASTSDSKKK